MRFSAFKPVSVVLLLNIAAAQRPARGPVSTDFRLVTEVSQNVVRAGRPVTVFANLTNRSEYSWSGVRVGIEASDELGSPLLQKVFEGQTFDSHGFRTCRVVFRFEEPVQVLIRVTLTRGKGEVPFFVRDSAARIAVTPVNVTGEGVEAYDRDGCK